MARRSSKSDRCPYSGLPIARCKASDLCDCFEFPEHEHYRDAPMFTHCPTCGTRHDDPKADDTTECVKCARLRALLAERYSRHERGK